MLRTEAFSDPEQLQAFLSQLYVFLVDEMHATLNKVMPQKKKKILLFVRGTVTVTNIEAYCSEQTFKLYY